MAITKPHKRKHKEIQKKYKSKSKFIIISQIQDAIFPSLVFKKTLNLTWIQFFQSLTISTNLLSLHNSPTQIADQPMEICTKDFEPDTNCPMPSLNKTKFSTESTEICHFDCR